MCEFESRLIRQKENMRYVIKNFMRNRMVNLTAKSVKHFDKEAYICVISLYKHDISEYANQEPLDRTLIDSWVAAPTKWVSPGGNANIHDSTVYGTTSGFGNPLNGPFFVEGYNLSVEYFGDYTDKLIILAEDHFFTSGSTIKELKNTDWDAAYASAFTPDARTANGAILGIVPSKVKDLFPIPEIPTSIENLLGEGLLMRIPQDRVHKLSTREWIDYKGDGIYTNSSAEMEAHMKAAGIL